MQGSCEHQFKVIDLTRLEIKPESAAAETDALTTRPSELLISVLPFIISFSQCSCVPRCRIGYLGLGVIAAAAVVFDLASEYASAKLIVTATLL